ncbi:DoxX family protein [Acuticoccus kandeliae]|uniref:DoxX family protein n=1 Tax=Acuticoccus kandeliae TaxID=2073160 RepID=UPI000D3E9574|nr:hypothetical protein [Acuticoccus kandeliae]
MAQSLSLLFLRVAAGFLLVWFGLDKIVAGHAPLAVQRSVDLEATLATAIGLATGAGEVVIGGLCVVGLWRKVALPLQALINGSTAAMVWWAIVDPFGWYITGVDRIVFNSHVFYSTIITFAACVLLITFQREDVWSLDALISRRARTRPPRNDDRPGESGSAPADP